MNFKIETFCDQGINANTYLVSNDNFCIIIDPANNIKTLNKFIDNKKVLGIFITHGHYDHFKQIEELLKKFDNIETIDDNDLKEMDFYEVASYLQTLNQVENLYDEIKGDEND